MMPLAHIAPELALVIGAAAGLVAALFLPRARQVWCAAVAIGALAAAAVLTARVRADVAPQVTFSGTHAVDELKAWATWIILGATTVVVVISPRWLASDRRHGEWYVVLLLSALGAILLAGAADVMQLMVAVILASTTGYTLASYHRRNRMSAEAGAKYFLLGAFANPLLFLGIVVLYGVAGSTGYAAIASLPAGAVDPMVLATATALVLVGLALEIGAAPVHAWLPDVAQGAPAPAAAFLTVVPKIGALAALLRVAHVLPDDAVPWRLLVAVMAAATMTLGNLAALWQEDVRRLLGWSSVSQAGYGLMAIVALGRSELALPALVVFMLAYGLANIAAFSVVVSLRGRTSRADYRGMSRLRPWHALALTVSLLSLLGLPPLVGFTAKLALFGAAIEAGYAWLAVLAVANTVVSLAYYLRIIAPMYFAAPPGKAARLGWEAAAVGLVAAGLLIAAGLAGQLVLDATAAAPLAPTHPLHAGS